MIISTWLAYIMARKGIGPPFPSASTPGIPAVEMGTVSLVEQWLHEIKDKTSRLFGQTLAGAAAQRAESTSAPPACQAASGPDPQEDVDPAACPLGRSLSHSFLENRTTIQLLRQSQTRVCCVLNVSGDEAAQEELEQMGKRMSQLMLQAETDTELDTDAQVLLSREN
ncbi:spermatogenesis-associated protein 19, mitochondrial [Theristicus caerulescens]